MINLQVKKSKTNKRFKMIRIEKRLPFGFCGDWGKLYKKYDYDDKEIINNQMVEFNKTNYVELTQDIQLKEVSDIEKSKEKLLLTLTSGKGYLTLKTTDSYYNSTKKEFCCVVDVDDLLLFNNSWWKINKVLERAIHTPNKQSFYYIEAKEIKEGSVNVK